MGPRTAARTAAAVVALVATAAGAGPGALESRVEREPTKGTTETYAVFDAEGRRSGSARWLVTDAGGNCCEVYVDSTRSGRLVEYGGGTPWFSDDAGRSWSTVNAVMPSLFGEGAVTNAPNGDILGVVWDYTQGNRVTAYKWDARSRKWYDEEVPVRGQFYDRPYITVVPGPFVVDGVRVPYVSVINSTSTDDDFAFISTDGLTYRPSSWVLDDDQTDDLASWLPSTPNAALDWGQGHPGSEMTALGQGVLLRLRAPGSVLRSASPSACETYLMRAPDPRWRCYELPGGASLPDGPLVAESRGWLHGLRWKGSTIDVSTSIDGARTWRTTPFRLPGGGTVIDSVARANGRLRRLAVATHVRRPNGRSVMLVSVLDTTMSRPRLLRTYQLGEGDIVLATTAAEAGPTGNGRLDFPSVAFLPDGRLALAMTDARHHPPQLAILQSRAP